VFALIGHNELGHDRKEHRVGVAPRPVAIADVPAELVVHHSTQFDAAASHDVFGGKLRFHWEVSKDAYPQDCAPLDRALPEGVKLIDPTDATARFSASTVGKYYARLTVLSDRTFGGHVSTNQECVKKEITVRDPNWLPFVVGGADFLPSESFANYGFRFKVGTTVRVPWLPSWLGGHFTQVLVRTDADGSNAGFGGGTTAGLALVPSNVFQAYVAAFGRFWGGALFAPEIGGELRLQRYLVLSGIARYEPQSGQPGRFVVGSFIGVGIDL
jgi:hypothetical protein